MAPFNTPWLTFLAWLVAGACVVFSIVWALVLYKPQENDDE